MEKKPTVGEGYRLLRTADKDTTWGFAIHLALDRNVPVSKIVEQLKSQYQDCPEVMRSCFNNIEKVLS